MIKIGQKLKLIPTAIDSKDMFAKKAPCEVVYINHKHRYFTAEFIFPGGKFLESFKFNVPEPGVVRIFGRGGE